MCVCQEKFWSVLKSSELQQSQPELLERLWAACGDAAYSLEPRERQLGLGEEVSQCKVFNYCLSSNL